MGELVSPGGFESPLNSQTLVNVYVGTPLEELQKITAHQLGVMAGRLIAALLELPAEAREAEFETVFQALIARQKQPAALPAPVPEGGAV